MLQRNAIHQYCLAKGLLDRALMHINLFVCFYAFATVPNNSVLMIANMPCCRDERLELKDVNAEVVEASDEGLEYWACYGHDLKKRSPMGQQFGRALKHLIKLDTLVFDLRIGLKRVCFMHSVGLPEEE